MTHRPRFVIVNSVMAAIGLAYWWLGTFSDFPAIPPHELTLIGSLAVMFCGGLIAAWLGAWDTVGVIAYLLPVFALFFTAVSLVSGMSGAADIASFHKIAAAIIPNAVGVAGMGWLKALAWFSAYETA